MSCYFVLPQEQEKCCGGGGGGGGGGCETPACRAAPRGRHTRANPHDPASNEECTQTCCCRACWNGTGTASNPASWNGSVRNMHKYAKNMQLYEQNMHKICKYIDCISQIRKLYARNMPEICQKYAYYMMMPLYAINMQSYEPNMQKNMQMYRLYLSNMHKICTKYARNMQAICRYMLKTCRYCQ